jgi:hypothetical protein
MPANQNYANAQANNRPAVPARAGGIPRLSTAVARGIRPEEPVKAAPAVRPTALAIPSPRDLGLGATPSAPVALDWTATHRQLDEIGAVRFEMQRLTTGGSRFSCWLPDGSTVRPVTGEGASEGEAVSRCLALARQARP